MADVLYIDACAGLSGDMLAGALLDLGYPIDGLRGLIKDLGLEGVEVEDLGVEHMHLGARRLQVAADHDKPTPIGRLTVMLGQLLQSC